MELDVLFSGYILRFAASLGYRQYLRESFFPSHLLLYLIGCNFTGTLYPMASAVEITSTPNDLFRFHSSQSRPILFG